MSWLAIKQVARRVSLLAGRGLVRASLPGLRSRIKVELLRGELRQVELLQPFGFAYRPPDGSEAVILSIGGDRAHGVAIVAHDRRSGIPDLEPGECALYNQSGSATIHLTLSGDVRVVSSAEVRIQAESVRVEASNEIHLDATTVRVSGDLDVTGAVSDQAGSMQEMRTFYNQHQHPGGGPPAPPMV
jgi:phage baseplate assembly protein V